MARGSSQANEQFFYIWKIKCRNQIRSRMPRTKKANSRNNIHNNNKSPNQWFQPELFTPDKQPTVKLVNGPIYGYVLPHASTTYTADIIKHTLRFQSATNPPRGIRNVIIFYYPAFDKENILDPHGLRYYHEYYVPMQSIRAVFPGQNLKFYGYNVRDQTGTIPPSLTARAGVDTWVIISADYSHYLPFQQAIELENQAAMALCYKQWDWPHMQQSVDNVATFRHVFDTSGYLPKSATLRWVGRTRSPGYRGVGYLSFLITDQATPRVPTGLKLNNYGGAVAGMFVTAYDAGFHSRECLGHWFDGANYYQLQTELELVTDVLTKARTTSRLTGGARLDVPVRYYTVTYLFQSRDSRLIRGWHGVMANGAFYLPDVFLENTYESGQWIAASNQEWKKTKIGATVMFDMRPTMASLSRKAGTMRNTGRYTLYDGYVKHVNL